MAAGNQLTNLSVSTSHGPGQVLRSPKPCVTHTLFLTARVISIQGRTGAVLGLLPAIDEAAHTLAACVQACLPYGGVQQVERIASDNPSHKLFTTLMAALPCLKSIALDPTHAAMRYKQASHGRRTRGSQLLRRLMVKFTTHDQAVTTNIWGPFYDGLPGHKLSGQEQSLRDAILDGSMSTARARRVLASSICESGQRGFNSSRRSQRFRQRTARSRTKMCIYKYIYVYIHICQNIQDDSLCTTRAHARTSLVSASPRPRPSTATRPSARSC